MDSSLKQDTRQARLQTPLGEDVLVLVRFEGNEGLSELFEYRIEAYSDKKREKEVKYDSLLGENCTVTIESYGQKRHFHGVAVEAQWIGERPDLHVHRIVLRPWLWLCSRTSDCRFFQDKTVPEIIKAVFDSRRLAPYRFELRGNYPKLEYCVQYRETDFAFVSRLMEHEGIYYFFEHTSNEHTLVLVDAVSQHKPVPGLQKIPFIRQDNPAGRRCQHIYQLMSQRRFRTGKVELNDYNELQSKADQKVSKKGNARYNKSDMEHYDYPGKYTKRDEGERYAQFILDAEQALDERRYTGGNAVGLFPGGLTELQDHPKTTENCEYLIVRASHLYVAEHYRSEVNLRVEEEYSGQFELLPKDKQFRAPIITPKPLIHGIQTAEVVGPEDEEIHVDKYGRIKVQFFWDRSKEHSCWIRVAQVWSGRTWGGQVIPRIGMEAVVEFLEGDPDRPLVTGTVYNDEFMHPFKLPDYKTQSGLKSNTSIGGQGYNQFKFEDFRGKEEINLHAQKDYKLEILDTEVRKIGQMFKGKTAGPNSRDTTLLRGDDQLTISAGNQTLFVAMNQTNVISTQTTAVSGSVLITAASITLVAPTINLVGNVFVGGTLTAALPITAPLVNGRP